MHARTYAVRRVCARRCSGPAEAETPPPPSAPAPPAAGEGGTPPLHLSQRGGDTAITPLTGRGQSQRGGTYYKEPDYDDIPPKYLCTCVVPVCTRAYKKNCGPNPPKKFHYDIVIIIYRSVPGKRPWALNPSKLNRGGVGAYPG